jgi:hypothetical protein
VIHSTYGIQSFQLVNVPDWVSAQRIDIVAKAESPVSVQLLQQMLQPLLAERFKLMLHTELREMDALVLTLENKDGRLGPRLRKSDAGCDGLGTTNRFAFAAPAPTGERPRCGILPAEGRDALSRQAWICAVLRRSSRRRSGVQSSMLPGWRADTTST